MPVNDYAHLVKHPDDWRFVRGLIHHAPDDILPALMAEYRRAWRQGAHMEPLRHKKDNAGRRMANTRLRRDAAAMEAGSQATADKYLSIVRGTQPQACSNCAHCAMDATCTKGQTGPGSECDEWESDFLRVMV